MTDVKISGLSTKSNEPSDILGYENWIAITDGTATKKMQRNVLIGTKLLAIKSISSGGVLATDDSGNPSTGTVSLPLVYTPASWNNVTYQVSSDSAAVDTYVGLYCYGLNVPSQSNGVVKCNANGDIYSNVYNFAAGGAKLWLLINGYYK